MPDPIQPPRSGLRLETPVEESFDVREFTVDDGLSSLFSVDLEVVSPNPAIDLEELIGQPASFHIELGELAYTDLPRRTWSGVISEAHLLRSEATGLSTYQLTISPTLWLLTRRTNCRVHQQSADIDVARMMLAEWGIDPIVECARSYKSRKYRVQYQETDFAFLSRLLEASGITFFHRLVDGASRLVLSDAPETGAKREETLEFADEPTATSRNATHFRASRALTAGRIAVADHDHRLANMPLVASSNVSGHAAEGRLESFVYEPGAFRFGNPGSRDTPVADDRGRTRTDLAEGQRIADQKGAAALARARRFAFDTNALDLCPGMVLSIGQHPMAERAGPMIVARTTITGSHDVEAHIAVNAGSAGAPWKPEVVTPTPILSGVECATVVGPEGETIHCDEFGRVRVQFHWDRYGQMNELSSCWVPVSQAWAGEGLGAMNLPRIGQEVIVSFLGGNPEEPMIVGRTFTNLLRPPVSLPENKTQNGFRSASVPATGGYNMFMFEDKAGAEEIQMRAERDWTTRVNHDTKTSVGRHRSASIEGDDKEQVQGNQREAVSGNKLGQVLGSLLQATAGQRILATVRDFVSSALSHRISSKVGTTLTVGQSMIHITPDAIIIQTPKLLLNPGADVAQRAVLTGQTPTPGGEN